VTGRPGSGKTTLAHTLAQAVRCPLISRDAIKEGLVNTLRKNGAAETDLNRVATDVYFDTLDHLLRSHVTLVTEAAFQHPVWSSKLLPFGEIARVKILCCTLDAKLAKQRYQARAASDPARVQFHDATTTLLDHYEPPHLPFPTLTVDTSDGYQPGMDALLAFIET
jgi:predicted kinase